MTLKIYSDEKDWKRKTGKKNCAECCRMRTNRLQLNSDQSEVMSYNLDYLQ
jgi:hypothetical protein